MDAFDRVIGYEGTKRELRRVADTLRHREAYEALGASAPRGLLLHGEPGVGKSLMAGCLIEESGRAAVTCRKTEPNGAFVGAIRRAFEEAAACAPSIVYLDDMDKFANDDERHRNSEEFVTVQSCIDDARDKEVFVLATANETCCLPHSLTRPGRFDRVIEVGAPAGEDAVRIVEHYLEGKRLAADVDTRAVAKMIAGKSCATLECVINEAALIAGYERRKSVGMAQVVEACLRVVLHVEDAGLDGPIDLAGRGTAAQAVWHEAGHAVVSEALCPGSVVLASARRSSPGKGGFVKCDYGDDADPLRLRRVAIAVALGGRAASEARFGTLDAGSESDLARAFHMARELFEDQCYGGLSMYVDHRTSASQDERAEIAATAALEGLYRTAREAICRNGDFLERMAAALAERDYLIASDIAEIRAGCEVAEVAV